MGSFDYIKSCKTKYIVYIGLLKDYICRTVHIRAHYITRNNLPGL